MALAALAVFAVTVPAVAAQVPPPPGEMPDGPGLGGGPHRGMFAALSEPGKKIMQAAVRGVDRRADQEAVKAARDRLLAVLDADRLDPQALARAMDAEREAANTAKMHHNAVIAPAFAQLSLADRRAFVADQRAVRARVEGAMAEMRARRQSMGNGAMPPPP